MPPLTSDQALQLGKEYHDLAAAVGNYRMAHWTELSEDDRASLQSVEWTLLHYSSDFLTQSVQIALDDVQHALEEICEATGRLRHNLETVQKVGDVLGFASKAVRIAAAVVTGHPDAIAEALAKAT